MPRGKRARDHYNQVTRASSSFSEQQVDAVLRLLVKLDMQPSVRELVPIADKEAITAVRLKFINMRGSMTAAQAAKRAREGEAAQ